MNAKRVVLSIISGLFALSGAIIFLVPIWYFADTIITNNNKSNTLVTYTINIFDESNMKDIISHYNMYDLDLNIIFSKIFETLVLLTLFIAAISLILTILSFIRKLQKSEKYIKVCKIFSISTSVCALLALTCAFAFTSQSVTELAYTSEITNILSINITTGIYLFVTFEIAAGICNFLGYIQLSNLDFE